MTTKHKTMQEETTDRKMELLAPAGTIEVFETAVSEGADAVYIGAPALNARALARNFTMAEIAAMITYAHENGVKVYVAMNSLAREDEIREVVEMLGSLTALKVDGLILQDLGIYSLARKFFPELRLHASTLLTAHNSFGVQQFSEMGFKRVVLSRELTVREISAIHRKTTVELEVFIHGAMCFSYSGLCLFSSYLGGKSGLRGRCVQPCRRRYSWAGRKKGGSGYFFSMNDLMGIEALPMLQDAGVRSIKIEGRMRSAHYVGSVVKAYRLALDALNGDERAFEEARRLLRDSMGRKSTTGYFLDSQPRELLSPQHSGNIGLFLGKVKRGKKKSASLTVKEPFQVGDRLRVHQEKTGERVAFTVKAMKVDGRSVPRADIGAQVDLELPIMAGVGDSLYKVDVGSRGKGKDGGKSAIDPDRFVKKVRKLVNPARVDHIVGALMQSGISGSGHGRGPDKRGGGQHTVRKQQHPGHPNRGKGRKKGLPVEWWLKIDDIGKLKNHIPNRPNRVVVVLGRQTFSQISRMRKYVDPYIRDMVWALPPVIDEADIRTYEEWISQLGRRGFHAWQIAHVGQLQFFRQRAAFAGRGRKGKKRKSDTRRKRYTLFGDYSLNALNSQTVRVLREAGINRIQAALETDRANLADLCGNAKGIDIGMTVYGTPPLFTARIQADYFQYDRPFVSPKEETFLCKKAGAHTVVVSEKPFSLLSKLPELAALGVRYVVVDLTNMHVRKGAMESLVRQLEGVAKPQRLSMFNYQGKLL